MLLILHVIDNLESGGAQTLLFQLATQVEESQVFSLHGSPGVSAFDWESVRHPRAERVRGASSISGLARLVRVCMRERRRALFIAHLDLATLALCLLKPIMRFRLLVMVHASPEQWRPWYRWCFARVIGFADAIVAGGNRHRATLIADGVASEKIVLVGTGSTLFDEPLRKVDADVRSALRIAPDARILLNVARMVPGKNQADVIRALCRIERTGVVAVIVGDGPERERLTRLAHELGVSDRVFLTGPRTDLHNFYAIADMLLMPCRDESMGVVILEALAYRLPIIAYNSGCIGEFIRNGENGILVPADLASLVDAVRRTLEARPRLDFSRNVEFSMHAMVRRFRSLAEPYLAGVDR
jgi:glycosyltransferase involved in cell wall biosynthesis